MPQTAAWHSVLFFNRKSVRGGAGYLYQAGPAVRHPAIRGRKENLNPFLPLLIMPRVRRNHNEGEFRFNAKRAFLTYSRAELIADKNDLFNFLKSLPHASKVIVARELHQDEGVHYHAVIEFAEKPDTNNPRFFDFNGVHPNISGVQGLKAVLKYVTKEDDFINDGFTLENKTPIVELVQEAAELPTREAALRQIMDRGGDRALRMFNNVDGYLSVLQRESTLYQPVRLFPDHFKENEPWEDAIYRFTEYFVNPTQGRQGKKSLWLHGVTKLGKTDLARSLGPHWYMQNMWNAACLDDNACYGVMDDIGWEFMKFNYKGMLGFQTDVTVTDKYKKKFVYKGGKGVIVCSNKLPDFTIEEWEWLEGNVEFVHITEPVYIPNEDE